MKKIPFVTTSEISTNKINDLEKLRKDTICNFFGKPENKVIFYDHHKCHALHGMYTQSITKDSTELFLQLRMEEAMVSMIVYLYLKKEINTFITIKNKFNRKNLFSNNITFKE